MDTTDCKSDEKKTSRKAIPPHIEQRENSISGNPEYYCTICQKCFRSRTQKYYHYGCNNNELKKYKCELCDKCFATRSHLAYHLETHNDKVYHCQDCRKSFTNRIVLQKHLKIHQRTGNFLCTQCSKEFKNKETLAAHIARHNNVLNFECSICSTKYATKTALEQHKLSHFAKKHECPQCGKRFQRNSILNLHLKRHKKTDLHFCIMCYKKFSDKAALQRHTNMHKTGGLTKYRCIQCDTITVRKDNMQRHVRNMHIGEHFSECVEIFQQLGEEQVTAENNEDSSVVENLELNERYLPKTVANSSVIKCIGNVEPVKVPNIVLEINNSEIIEPIVVAEPVKDAPIRTKKLKKKYDPIEMYRKIMGTEDDNENEEEEDDQTESLTDDLENTVKIIEKPRNTALNISNFSETHWRKNFKYTYQHQEY